AVLPKIQAEDILRKLVEPLLAPAAAKRAQAGDRWTLHSQTRLGLIGLGPTDGAYESSTEYTYEGPSEGLHRVSSNTMVTYKGMPGTGLPSQMTSKEGKGTFLFDAERGQLASADTILHMHGTLTTGPEGQQNILELDQHQRTRLKTYDRNPLEK